MKFCVVITTYTRDDPVHLSIALDSLLNQDAPPDQIVIVADGPISVDLREKITSFLNRCDRASLLQLPENRGQGYARHQGIRASKYELIALMDADDVCRPNRFALSLDAIGIDNNIMLGGAVEEFSVRPGDLGRRRIIPSDPVKLERYQRYRQPVNNVTLVFNRELYFKAGGYHSVRHIEDWDLIYRMQLVGGKIVNLPDVLVDVRVGNGMLGRRRGLKYLRSELDLFNRMLEDGYLTVPSYFINVLSRVFIRLLPLSLVKLLYSRCLRT